MSLLDFSLVAVGGFFGAVVRASISQFLNKKSLSIPIGTLFVNLLGSLLLGVVLSSSSGSILVLLFGTGFMGAFTTFSTLSLEMLEQFLNERKRVAIVYLISTYGGGIFFAYIGFTLGKFF